LPNRGVQVLALSREDVRHAFEVMASLEGLAGELAAPA
jgi:DNA-binding GntR family transcriptional regulator